MAPKRNQTDIFRLSITLQRVEHKITRRMDVPTDTCLDDLHYYIQAAMGWDNDHTWGFEARRYGRRAYWSPEHWDDVVEETIHDVIAFLQGNRDFTYVYDFGDHWEHRIRIGKAQPARDDRRYPYLVSGTGRCPIEDIGGGWGYQEFLRGLEDPNSPYREEFADLYKGNTAWDPEDAQLETR